jgi:hypothetical protein
VIEHLLIVRFVARRIHERLPQHVLIDDLYSAGVVGLLAAVGRFGPSWDSYSVVMRNSASVARFLIACGRWIGVLGNYGARGGQLNRRSRL